MRSVATESLVPAEEIALRVEVDRWLAEHWADDRPLLEWRDLLAESGWGCPSWPVEFFGRGLSVASAAIVAEQLDTADAVGVPMGSAMSLAAPTILALGSDELKRRLLHDIVTGRATWCQLFSEPGNGSDLAGLTTRADRDGDEWIVNGQKLWTTGAHKADYGMLLARTDWDVPKHRGITYFAIDMHQPGIEVRGVRQMNEYSSFNEVFLSDARVPHANVVGDVGQGWAAALTTLAHERGLGRRAVPDRAPVGRTRQEADDEARAYNQTYIWYPQRGGRADLVQPRAKETGTNTDPVIRQQIAALHSFERVSNWTVGRANAARAAGRTPGPEGSLAKLAGSEISRRSNAAHTAITKAHAMLGGSDGPLDGVIHEVLISTPAASIAGGTDEIQHDIIGERALGLPKEPSVDKDIAFRQVRVNQPRTA